MNKPGERETIDDVEVIAFADGRAFEDWLADNHPRPEGVWAKLAKKQSGDEVGDS